MKTQKGFSLVEIMVILGAIGGIALLVTKLGQNSNKIQTEAVMARDYNDLQREAHFILQEAKFCKASLAGTKFKTSQMETPISGIELWTSDSAGKRDSKKFSKETKMGGIDIEDIVLTMGKNISEPVKVGDQFHYSSSAVIKIKLSKANNAKHFSDIEQSINVTFSSDSSTGMASIINCEDINMDMKEIAKVWCGTILNPCGSEIVQAVGTGKYSNGRFTGIYDSVNPVDFKICKAAVNQPATLSLCE